MGNTTPTAVPQSNNTETGNGKTEEKQFKIPRAPNDLPPPHTIDDLNTLQTALYVDFLEDSNDNGPCGKIAQLTREMDHSGTLDNLSEDDGTNWAHIYSLICTLSYLDRRMYECMRKHSVTIPDDINSSFESMVNRYRFSQLNPDKELQVNPVAKAALECTDLEQHAWNVYQDKLVEIESDAPVVIPKQFSDLAQQPQPTYAVTALDNEESISRKTRAVLTGPCKKYVISGEPTEGNQIHHKVLLSELAMCVSAALCSQEIQKCISKGNKLVDCMNTNLNEGLARCHKYIHK